MYILLTSQSSQSSNPISAQQNLSLLWTNRQKGPNVCELSCTYGGQSVQVEALIKGIGGCVTNLSALFRSNQIWQHLSSISENKRRGQTGTQWRVCAGHRGGMSLWTHHRAYLQPCLSAKERIYREQYHHSSAWPERKKTFFENAWPKNNRKYSVFR